MKITEFMKSKKGASGIGTLIVFIAMVLVAAVAASVLINTSGYLQQKASTTGKESTDQVASGLQVLQVTGKANAVGTDIDYVTVLVTPNAGSGAIDLSQVTLMITDGATKVVKKYTVTTGADNDYYDKDAGSLFNTAIGTSAWNITGTMLPATGFGIKVIQDEDLSCLEDTPVINKGDLVAITMVKGALVLDERTPVSGEIQPEFGAPGIMAFTTPSTYDANGIMELQ
ncbi:flagellin [Methanococcus maripaludis]|uniref:Flagellin n=1 Tax=Methanococcus maripaludis TaxID=39152 RepID=A0A7J9P949_METMI|nr:flagellin [Methanococcus maripaludis]MBA2859267.1 flagellin FlaB [Methanococcus maripaludis]